MTRHLKRILGIGAAAGMLFALWRWLAARREESGFKWEAQPLPYPPRPTTPADDVEGEETA
jgi:hypothetical protein